jgi:hypothetical protein
MASLEPALALQQEGAAVDTRKPLRIQLKGAAPVSQRAVRVARTSAHLCSALD